MSGVYVPQEPAGVAQKTAERPSPHSRGGFVAASILALAGSVQPGPMRWEASLMAAMLGGAVALAARSFRRRVGWKAGVLVFLGGYFVVYGFFFGLFMSALGVLLVWAGFRKPRPPATPAASIPPGRQPNPR